MKQRVIAPLLATLLVAGCGGFEVSKLLPSSGTAKEQDLSRTPPGATAYLCEGGKRLFVRYADKGETAWVILPDREFRLDKAVAASGARYSNGAAILETKGNEAMLNDGPTATYTGCKATGK